MCASKYADRKICHLFYTLHMIVITAHYICKTKERLLSANLSVFICGVSRQVRVLHADVTGADESLCRTLVGCSSVDVGSGPLQQLPPGWGTAGGGRGGGRGWPTCLLSAAIARLRASQWRASLPAAGGNCLNQASHFPTQLWRP